MPYRSLLEEVIGVLSKNPYVALESALLQPGRSKVSLEEFEKDKGVRLPQSLTQFYTEVGAAHVSWHLSPGGYEKLYPGAEGNGHKYDVSGNFDLLSPEEVSDGFTGDGWKGVYGNYSTDYYPVDFSSYFLNLGFTAPLRADGERLLLNVLYEDRLAQLDITLAEYLRRGAEVMFIADWQLSLLNDEKYAPQVAKTRELNGQLVGLSGDELSR